MNPIKTLRNVFKKKVVDLSFGGLNLDNVGWQSLTGSSAFNFYKRNDLENGYASIRVIVNNFAKTEQYTIDKTGKYVGCNILDRLYTPNTLMSAYEFREALAVMTLTHNKVRIRVHYDGESPKADNIKGFTFLEGEFESIIDGKRQYRMANGDVYTDDEVITLLNINPYDLDAGFSPAMAARRWTKIDDYIADYQAGFFENHAIPAGQIIVTAKTPQDFNDIVDELKRRHKGAGHNNNVTYTHRPTDSTGKAMNAQVEWVPFATPNNNMALKEIFDEVNKKIDSAYGVPASLRGVNDNNTYASVKVDQKILIENVIEPLVMKIWGKFTHELNRITGGTGVAITADVEVPEIADEQLVKAQAKQVHMSMINMMTMSGFTIESIVDAFELPESYKLLGVKKTPPVEEPDIIDTENIQDTPDQPIDNTKEVKKKELSAIDEKLYIEQYKKLVHRQMVKQIDRAIAQLPEVVKSKSFGDTTDEDDQEFINDVILLMTPLIAFYGQKATNLGVKLILEAGLSTEYVDNFAMSKAQKTAYRKYVKKVARGYTEYTADQIRSVLERGILDGQNVNQIANNLRTVITGSENAYRIDRIARTEVHLAESKSSVMAMENIADSTGYKVYKVWFAGGAEPCEFCQAMNNTEVPISDAFIGLGDKFVGADGGVLNNDFTATEEALMHPNCECTLVYRVEAS